MTGADVMDRGLTLAGLLSGLDAGADLVEAAEGIGSVPITRAVIDSRRVTDNCLFIALRGERSHGHEYVEDAVGNGAVAVVTDRMPPSDLSATVVRVGYDSSIDSEASAPFCLVVGDSFAALQRLGAFCRRQYPIRVIGITGSVGKTTTKELAAAVLARRYVTLKSAASYNNEIGLPLTLMHLTREHECDVLEMGM